MTGHVEPEDVLRRRVTWLRTTSAPLPAYIRGALADEIEQLLDAEQERADKVRAACAGLGHLATGVLAALDGDQALAGPDFSAVRDAVGEDQDDNEIGA